jgi:hypothetical protein
MSTASKSRCNDVFNNLGEGTGKNGLRISPINDDLPLVNTWGIPKISLFSGRSRHHDA